MFNVTVYTDGACSGNPGVGGYGAIISYNGVEKEISGFSVETTTNNKMELKAVIEAIRALKHPCHVDVYTDSKYLVDCSCKKKDWFIAENRPNKDMWLELISLGLNGGHKIKFVKIKGHSGDELNERCDKIAKEQCNKAKHKLCER